MFGKAFLLAAASILIPLPGFLSAMRAQETPSSPGEPKSHRMPVPREFSYSCDGGIKVKVTLRENRARVTFKDKSFAMKQVESGSGVRYAQGHIVWTNKGLEGFLQDETDLNHPVKLAENCRQTQAKTP